jgi:hypothetical protein
MSGYDLIPAAMLVVTVVAVVCALFNWFRAGVGAGIVLLLLFVVSLWFPEPPLPDHPNMHWFPASLAVLLFGYPLIVASALLGWIVRGLLALVRSARRKGTGHEPGV